MAATTLRYENTSWLPAAGAMVALAVGAGYALAMGEIAGLYVALALIGSVAVLLDFRIGALVLLVMLPASASTLFPHSLMQITGLDPLTSEDRERLGLGLKAYRIIQPSLPR